MILVPAGNGVRGFIEGLHQGPANGEMYGVSWMGQVTLDWQGLKLPEEGST